MTCALAYESHEVRKIALVGLGGGRTISYFVASFPQITADVAELDPSVIALAQKYFAVTPNERLRISNKDGRVFLNQTKDKFDIILLDAYRGPFVPFHLTTQEFYKLVKSRLNEGGVVAQNVEPSTMFFDSAYATMKSVFANVDAFDAGGNIVLVGYGGEATDGAGTGSAGRRSPGKWKLKYDMRELVKARKDVTVAADAKVLTGRLRSRGDAEDHQAAQREKAAVAGLTAVYVRRSHRRIKRYEIDPARTHLPFFVDRTENR
jgi:spermidine synthase